MSIAPQSRPAKVSLQLLVLACTLLVACRPSTAHAGGLDTPRKTILIDNSERQHGHTPLAPLWTDQLRRRFILREQGTTGYLPGQDQAFRITTDTLAGNDLVILTGFSGSMTFGDRSGTREISYDHSDAELAAIERYVRDGGNLLIIPWPMGRPNNLGALLARFGLELRGEDSHYLEAPAASGQPTREATQSLTAQLTDRAYALLASRWFYPLHAVPAGATVIATDAGKPLIAEVASGAGRVVYLGLPNLSDGMGSSQVAFAADNPAFFLDLVAHASGDPAPTTDETTRATWDLRAAALRRTLFNGLETRPTLAEWAARLQQMATTGQRCDLGPGCVAWRPTAEQHAFLAQHRATQDAMMATFAQLEAWVQQGSWVSAPGRAALERAYANLLSTLSTEQGQQVAFADLYRSQGGIYPHYPDENPLYALGALGGTLLFLVPIFLCACGITTAIRRRRRKRQREVG